MPPFHASHAMPADSPSSSLTRSIATHAVTGIVSGAVVLAVSAMLTAKGPAVSMDGASAGPPKIEAMKPPVPGPIVGTKLILLDPKGLGRATLSYDDSGNPTLAMHGPNGAAVGLGFVGDGDENADASMLHFSVGGVQRFGISVSHAPNGPVGLVIRDQAANVTHAVLSSPESSAIVLGPSNDEKGNAGRGQIALEIENRNKQPRLLVQDANGGVLLNVTPDRH